MKTPLNGFAALATDYDETLAHCGVVEDATVEALERFRATGRPLILVTGRHTPDLVNIFPRFDLFDVAITENGGTLYEPRTRKEILLAEPFPRRFLDCMRSCGVDPFFPGRVVIASIASQQDRVRRAIQASGVAAEMVLNYDNLMILPPGVDKASGVRAAAKHLGIATDNMIAVGDAENDEAFLAACGLGVAVANALPAICARAALQTREPHGAGVRELIERLLSPATAGCDTCRRIRE
jgi:HAD superfamily hydrolase (TIGR01484 family)